VDTNKLLDIMSDDSLSDEERIKASKQYIKELSKNKPNRKPLTTRGKDWNVHDNFPKG